MSAEAQQWYIDLFDTLYKSEEWQKFCIEDGLDCTEWVAGDDLGAFHAEQIVRHKELIEKVGAARHHRRVIRPRGRSRGRAGRTNRAVPPRRPGPHRASRRPGDRASYKTPGNS